MCKHVCLSQNIKGGLKRQRKGDLKNFSRLVCASVISI